MYLAYVSLGPRYSERETRCQCGITGWGLEDCQYSTWIIGSTSPLLLSNKKKNKATSMRTMQFIATNLSLRKLPVVRAMSTEAEAPPGHGNS